VPKILENIRIFPRRAGREFCFLVHTFGDDGVAARAPDVREPDGLRDTALPDSVS